MSFTVETRRESARGCGYRKAGGLYLVCDGQGRGCGRIPFPLCVCPTCNQGIKPARGWTWVDSGPIIEAMDPCVHEGPEVFASNNRIATSECFTCPMRAPMGQVGLIWVGEKFYPTPDDFTKEAGKMGISRRIPAVPNDFVLGETWVWLAHRKAIDAEHEEDCAKASAEWLECNCEAEETPGIFHVFLPDRIEYVVKDDDEDEKLERMSDRGITLVQIEKADEPKAEPDPLLTAAVIGMPTMRCPQCGAEHPDYDGVGFVAHVKPAYEDGCGYCRHPARDLIDGKWVCGICGDEEEEHGAEEKSEATPEGV
jgi:hypothetical protein